MRLGGVDVRDLRVDDLRRRIGLVTQDVQLFAGTLRDNVRLFDPDVSDERLVAVFASLGLDEWLAELPDGLDTVLGPTARGLSAGEAQLVALARVFLEDPGLVVLDEASSRLDPHTEALLEHADRPAARRPDRHRDRPPAPHDRAGRRGARPRRRTGRRARRPGWRSPPTPRRASPSCCAPGSRRCGHEARARRSSASRGATSPAARAFGALLYCVAPLALGLATRAFFDRVAGDAAGAAWVAVALVAAVQAGEVLSELAVGRTWSGFCYETHTLLQRNALAGILRGFGRFGLPVPPGDAISRFRDEPPSITMGSMDGIADLVGRGLFAFVGGAVMWRIDPVLTVAAFAPVVASSVGQRRPRHPVGRPRGAAARESTGRLTGFLGELVGANLAVRVAGAAPHVVRPAGRDQRDPPTAVAARPGVRRDRQLDELPPRARRHRRRAPARRRQDPHRGRSRSATSRCSSCSSTSSPTSRPRSGASSPS